MVINGKQYFYALNRGKSGEYILVDFGAKKEKIITVSKDEIKKQLYIELKNRYEDSGIIEKKFKEKLKTLFYEIESVYVEFDPYSPSLLYEQNGTKYFNLFKNTEIREKMLKIYKNTKNKYKDFEFLKKFSHINFLLNSLTNNNKEHKYYLLNWLAYIFITHKKTMNTIILRGTEGAGKNLFFEKIIKKVFGEEQVTIISNNELTSEFNSFIENRSFIVANEIQDYTNKKSMYEKLKQWITDSNFIANAKYDKHRNVENYANFLIFSNNDIPVPISITDRRYSVIETRNLDLKIQVEKELGIDIVDFIEELENEVELFLYDIAKYEFNAKNAIKVLKNKERENIILNTEEKTKILKRKIVEMDKTWFLTKYKEEYLHFIEKEEYFEITEKLGLGKINDNIDDTHKIIIDEIFNALELKNFVPNAHLKYLMYFMYFGNKELKELNKYVAKLGEKTTKAVWFNNKSYKGIIFKIIAKKEEKNAEIDELEKLKKENEKLKKENEELNKKLAEKNKLINILNERNEIYEKKLEEAGKKPEEIYIWEKVI